MLGQRAAASAERHLRDPRRAADRRRSPRRRRPRRPRPAWSSSTTCASPTPTATPVLDGFSLLRRARRDRRPRRPHRQRQVDGGSACCCASTTSTAARVLLDGHDVRDLTRTSVRHHVGVVLDEPFLFSDSIRANIAYGAARRRPTTRSWPRPRPRRPTASSARCPTATTRSSASAATTCRAASASASPSPARCWPTRASSCSTTPPARSTCRSRSASTTPSAPCWPAAPRSSSPTGCRRSPSPTASCCSKADGSWPSGSHTELLATEPRYAEVLARVRGGCRAGRRRETIEDELATLGQPADGAVVGGAAGPADGVGRGRGRRLRAVGDVVVGRRRPALRRRARGAGEQGARSSSTANPSTPIPTSTTPRSSRDHRPFTLRRFLAPHRAGLAGAGVLVVIETLALQAGPLLTQIGIDHGISTSRTSTTLVVVAIVYVVTVLVSIVAGAAAGGVDRPAGRAPPLRAAHPDLQPPPATLARLLHRREGRPPHDPHDERRRGPLRSSSRTASSTSPSRASPWSWSAPSSCSPSNRRWPSSR